MSMRLPCGTEALIPWRILESGRLSVTGMIQIAQQFVVIMTQ